MLATFSVANINVAHKIAILTWNSVKSWTTQAADAFAALNAQTAAAFESMAENIRDGFAKLAINSPPEKLVEPEIVQPEENLYV